MNNIFIENHPLVNKRMFSQEENHATSHQIEELKKSEGVVVLNLKQIKKFIADVDERCKDLSKSEIDDYTDSVYRQLERFTMVNVVGEGKKMETYFIAKKAQPMEQLSKSVKSEEDVVEKKDDKNIEKGYVSDAFRYSSKLQFNKTGKEIKAKIAALKTKLESENEELVEEIDEHLDEATTKPTEKLYDWSYRGFKNKIGSISYKKYRWEMCSYYPNSESKAVISSTDGDAGINNILSATSKEMADECREYNDNVEKYIDNKVEIASMEFLANNIEDSKKYELSQEQAMALNF